MPRPPRIPFLLCVVIILACVWLSADYPEYENGFISLIIGVAVIFVADTLLLER